MRERRDSGVANPLDEHLVGRYQAVKFQSTMLAAAARRVPLIVPNHVSCIFTLVASASRYTHTVMSVQPANSRAQCSMQTMEPRPKGFESQIITAETRIKSTRERKEERKKEGRKEGRKHAGFSGFNRENQHSPRRPRQLFSAVQMLERGHYLDGLPQTHFVRENA